MEAKEKLLPVALETIANPEKLQDLSKNIAKLALPEMCIRDRANAVGATSRSSAISTLACSKLCSRFFFSEARADVYKRQPLVPPP